MVHLLFGFGQHRLPSPIVTPPPDATGMIHSLQQINEFSCTHCKLRFTSKSAGQTCPECKQGTIQKCTRYSAVA